MEFDKILTPQIYGPRDRIQKRGSENVILQSTNDVTELFQMYSSAKSNKSQISK